MSQDSRRDQSKSDRPSATTTGLPRPPAPAAPAAKPAVPAPPAVPEDAGWAPAVPAPPAAPVDPASPAVPGAPAIVPEAAVHEDAEDEEEELPLTLVERIKRLPPAPVILTAGSIGSLLFLLRAVTSHTTPVSILMSAAVVTGLIFGVDAVVSSIGTWRASQDGDSGRALVLALVGGVSYVVSLGAFAGLLIMVLVLNS